MDVHHLAFPSGDDHCGIRDGAGSQRCDPCRGFFFFRVLSYQIRSLTQSVRAMLWSMAQTSKTPASDGGLCSGQLLMMWPAVCSGSPHSHAALSASPCRSITTLGASNHDVTVHRSRDSLK